MSWEIVTKTDTAKFCRVATTELLDSWYDISLGLIERHTGWYSLSVEEDVVEYVNGPGNAILVPKFPINSVSSIYISGVILPSTYYYTAWNQIEIRTYRIDEVYDLTVQLERITNWGEAFPFGIRNINLTYNVGGVESLPSKYLYSLKSTLLMVIKEFSTVPRNEGSDSMLKKYRPDRTMLPEEVLTSYGVHGKIKGILKAMLPKQRVYI